MKKIIAAIFISCCFASCGDEDASRNNNERMEEIYSGGTTNLNTHIYKIKIDSVIYIIAYRREGIAIIKHGEIK